ncbi:hypothetical protein BDR26DRAFT_173133 [Obelidium mucronatum]|nr:hypothetical protein BDR26DRAFT_173133 [Obelidium mucronatum]
MISSIAAEPLKEHNALPQKIQQSQQPQQQQQQQQQQTRSMAPQPNLAASRPQLSLDKAKLFEVFKKDYPGTNWIEEQKLQLKGKYAEAKKLGELANELRLKIKHIKDTLAQPDDRDAATVKMKEELRSTITEKVGAAFFLNRYKQAYQDLKDLKIEIEHMQHLLEQARMRLSRAFEQWYENVYMSNENHNEDDSTASYSDQKQLPPPDLSNQLANALNLPRSEGASNERRKSLVPGGGRAVSSLDSYPEQHESISLAQPPRPASTMEQTHYSNRAHHAFVTSSSPYSSTSTLFLNDSTSSSQSTPQVSANILQAPSNNFSAPIAWNSTAGATNVVSKQIPPPPRSFSSLDRTSLSSPLPLLPPPSSKIKPQLIPPTSDGRGNFKSTIDSRGGVDGDIEAFYNARDGLLLGRQTSASSSSGLPKGTPGFVGRLLK